MSRGQFDRNLPLIGNDGQQKLSASHVMIVGCGGVGGYIAEFLARAGVGRLTLIDSDTVDITNLNRQIIALSSTLEMDKTEVLKKRLLDINRNMQVLALKMRYSCDSSDVLDSSPDYVADAIDSVADKAALITECKKRGIPVISAMGAGNKCGIPAFGLTDIYSTSNDGLAKALRKKLRESGVAELSVVTDASPSIKTADTIASISYYPPACATVIAAKIIGDLTAR